jgi:predicted PolB exonuclease-like 3'-5' exonuclease
MAIILDIETLAVDGVDIEPVSAPANYKDPEKIAAYIADAERAQRDKAALYPWTARIIALGWCYDTDDAVQVRTTNNEAEEADILTEFWARVVDQHGSVTPLVTYNGLGFDLPVLQARSTILGLKAPTLNLDRYRSPHPDLMQLLTFRGAIAARSLTWFAKRFGLDTSDAFSGKEIAGLVEDGNWDAIRSHCESDVRLTRQLAERLGVIRQRKG